MRLQRLAVLALAMLMGVDKALGEDAKKDLEKLQGEWELVSAELKGKDITNGGKRAFRLTIKGKKFVLQSHGTKLDVTFRMDSAKTPKTIDCEPKCQKTLLGSFAFEGDKLKLSLLPAGEGRPKGFTTDAKTNQVTFVVKRKKP
jgi:uncharacterized protein (TIGR03067 family)